jgi:hypothetical protein
LCVSTYLDGEKGKKNPEMLTLQTKVCIFVKKPAPLWGNLAKTVFPGFGEGKQTG